MSYVIYQAIHIVLNILVWLIMVDVVLSYLPSVPRYHPLVLLIRRVTRPILSPFRKILPPQRLGDAYIDFSPVLAIVVLYIIDYILASLKWVRS